MLSAVSYLGVGKEEGVELYAIAFYTVQNLNFMGHFETKV